MMMSYEGQKLRSIDKNLLRGLYVRKIKDFKEDMHEKFGNKSLYARLKSEFLKAKTKHMNHHVKIETLEMDNSANAQDKDVKKKDRVRRQTKIKALNSSASLANSIKELKISQANKKEKKRDDSDNSQQDDPYLKKDFKIKSKNSEIGRRPRHMIDSDSNILNETNR